MNRERLVSDAVVGGHLGHSDDKKIELSFLRGVRKEVIQTTVLDFWKVYLAYLGFWPWDTVLKDKGMAGHFSRRRS